MRTSPLVSILGPTACGKTAVAVGVARAIGGAILSADSRQLYRGMDIGTGKDLEEYAHPEHGAIAHYLIDVADAGERWSLYTYLEAFYKAHADAAAALRRGRDTGVPPARGAGRCRAAGRAGAMHHGRANRPASLAANAA